MHLTRERWYHCRNQEKKWSEHTRRTVGSGIRFSRARAIIHSLPPPGNDPKARLYREEPKAAWGSFTPTGRVVISWYQGARLATITCTSAVLNAVLVKVEQETNSEPPKGLVPAGTASPSESMSTAQAQRFIPVSAKATSDDAPVNVHVLQRNLLEKGVQVESTSFATYVSRDTWLSACFRPHSQLLRFTKTLQRELSTVGVYPHHETTELIKTHHAGSGEYTYHWIDWPEAFTATIPSHYVYISLLAVAD